MHEAHTLNLESCYTELEQEGCWCLLRRGAHGARSITQAHDFSLIIAVTDEGVRTEPCLDMLQLGWPAFGRGAAEGDLHLHLPAEVPAPVGRRRKARRSGSGDDAVDTRLPCASRAAAPGPLDQATLAGATGAAPPAREGRTTHATIQRTAHMTKPRQLDTHTALSGAHVLQSMWSQLGRVAACCRPSPPTPLACHCITTNFPHGAIDHLTVCALLTCLWCGCGQALSGKVHHLVLSLPAAALKPEHAAHMCAIMRHLLEDPATLQAAMEAEIRSTLTARGPTRNATGTLFTSLLCR